MGFKDREQILKALIESKGDVDGALERLCQDWEETDYLCM